MPGRTSSVLALTNVQPTDAAAYDVVVSNIFGVLTSSVEFVTVNVVMADLFRTSLSITGLATPDVYSMALQPDGRVIIGGQFTVAGGLVRSNIARINVDGTVDAGFNPGAKGNVFGNVYALAFQPDGKLLAGGAFTNLGGQARSYIGRLDTNGNLDATFNASIGSSSPGVWSIAVQADGKILVGGKFTSVSGFPRTNVARLFSTGTIDSTFNASTPGNSSLVHALLLQPDGKILVAGSFPTIGGIARSNLARLNTNGTVDSAFNPQPNDAVFDLAQAADGKILAGGIFTTMGGQARSRIARLNPNGTLDGSFNPGADGEVDALALQSDGRVIAAGSFKVLAGRSRSYIGRLNADGSVDPNFNPVPNGAVHALALQKDGKILAGGLFTAMGITNRSHMARLNNTDAAVEEFQFNGSGITWSRSGTGPEVWKTTFESSTNGGGSWTNLGTVSRISGGWQLAGGTAPPGSMIRARGYVAASMSGTANWFLETTLVARPFIPAGSGGFGFSGSTFGFPIDGGFGWNVVIDASTDLQSWSPLLTNTVGPTPFYFSDSGSATLPIRFYRLRAQ